ncbi:WD40 repeat domain-containing protein [Patescibacteria group bacterium]|nr:WD40 repeat domain-containing protein [Patescibacteria group bacterium]
MKNKLKFFVLFLLLVVLVLVGAGCGEKKVEEEGAVPSNGKVEEEAEKKTEKEPLWWYFTEDWIAYGGLNEGGISMSLDGNYIVAGASDAYGPDNVLFFEKDSSIPLWNYQVDDLEVQSVSISPDGNYIAVGTFAVTDGKLYFFQKDNPTPLWIKGLRPFDLEEDEWVPLRSVSISADGDYIAVGMENYGELFLVSKDGQILWSRELADFNLSRVETSISSDGNYVAAVCPSLADQQRIYLFERDAEIIGQRPVGLIAAPLWSYKTGGAKNFDLYSISISSDGNYVAAGSSNKLYFFSKDSGTPLWTYPLECDYCSVSLSSDGKYLAVSAFRYGDEANSSTVYLFKKDSSVPLWSYASDSNTGATVSSVAISADGKHIAAVGEFGCYFFQRDSSVPLWEYSTLLMSHEDFPIPTPMSMGHACISSDGNYMVAGGTGGGGVLFFDKTVPGE